MQKIKKGDKVRILKGKDSGKESSVERVLSKRGLVVVSGVNVYKRSISGKKAGIKEGGVIDIVKPVRLSNVALVCGSCGKATRVGFVSRDGKTSRVCKKCGKET